MGHFHSSTFRILPNKIIALGWLSVTLYFFKLQNTIGDLHVFSRLVNAQNGGQWRDFSFNGKVDDIGLVGSDFYYIKTTDVLGVRLYKMKLSL